MIRNFACQQVFKSWRYCPAAQTFRKFNRIPKMCAASTRLPWVSVFTDSEEERLRITFTHLNKTNGKSRVYNLNRAKDEELQISLTRLAANVSKVVKKKNKKRKKDDVDAENVEPEGVKTVIIKNGKELSGEVKNEQAWETGSLLQIEDVQYEIQVNPPACLAVNMPSVVMVGYPVYIELDVSGCHHKDCRFSWLRRNMAPEQKRRLSKEAADWEEVSNLPEYCPTFEDIGQEIKVVCTPSREELIGEPLESPSRLISEGPALCPFEKRHQQTTERCKAGSFRIVSYNILADLYADSDHSRENLFPYCPTEYLAFGYRKQLILKEILGYNADVLCLQEVDRKFFINSLSDVMNNHGFSGMLSLKPGEVAEGSAVFYRRDKFCELSRHDIDMMHTFRTEERYQDLLKKVDSNEALAEIVHERKSEVQVTVLESIEDSSKKLLVATTHLYFHPRANNVRAIQAAIALGHLQSVVELYRQKGDELSVVFCGDFNASNLSGAVEFITNGSIPANHADWYVGGRQQFVPDMHLQHPFRLASAAGYPMYTNYVGGFRGCLDHIFIEQDKLETEQVIPIPEHEDVTKHTALPNVVFPSDHLAVVCDVKWKS